MGIVLGLIIVFLILLINKNKEIERLTYENKRLREELRKYETGEIKAAVQTKKVETKAAETVKQTIVKPEQVVVKKTQVDEKEKKNITILVTGAICIVLAAIVFLISTWTTIPDLLKTSVLVLLTVVFFVGSNLAENKYKLPKASKVFYYIGMAYIPICLFSISIFKLFGEYLSFTGDGKYIYFVFSAVLTSLIYYMNRKDRCLLVGSILSQCLAIVAFSLVISEDIILIGINLLLYNLLLMLITKDEMFKWSYKILPWLATIIVISGYEDVTISLVFMQLALALNYLMLEFKKLHKINAYMFNIALVGTVLSIFKLLEETLVETALHYGILVTILVIHTIQSVLLTYKKNKNLIDASALVTGAALVIAYLINIFEEIIPLYVISTAIFGVFTYYYLECKGTIKNVVEVILPLSFIATGINALSSMEASYHSYALFAFAAYLISELTKEKLPTLYVKTCILTHINLLLTVFISSRVNGYSENTIYLIGLVLVYGYSYLSSKLSVFKYATYISTNFMLYAFFTMLDYTVNPMYYIPMITTVMYAIMETKLNKTNNVFSDIYLIIAELVSFTLMYSMRVENTPELPVILAFGSGALITYLTKGKGTNFPHYVAIVCMLPGVLMDSLKPEIKSVLVLAAVAGLSFVSVKKNAWSIYTVISGIYLVGAMEVLESIYLKEIAFLAWSVAHLLFVDKEYQQDIFKGLTYIAGLLLYTTIIEDLELTKYTLFTLLGYLVVTVAGFKTIISRYIKDAGTLMILESVAYGIIYFIALTMYIDELDGIMFVSMLIAVIIASYIKKYHAIFLTTSVAVIINIFLLTREFWFSIPWWLYLLIAGIVLITFAVNNEANENKKGVTLKGIVKYIQEKVNESEEQ